MAVELGDGYRHDASIVVVFVVVVVVSVAVPVVENG